MTVTHELKTWPEPFLDIVFDRKTFEFRRDDRNFQVGDDLLLREWTPENGYTGREITVSVIHLIRGPAFGIPEGFVCMSIQFADVIRWRCGEVPNV